ncbi:drug/metabolite transporter permease [Klebsiella michiganensis]|uniref:Drug/metabolite transporter permease n=1 Tax=Klebsiella michiganensis TaxID=1134687 RepID=A0A7H4MYJ7_9ENTR|nr:drug/metabolite transporter permease [Klebsiella michiganensis]
MTRKDGLLALLVVVVWGLNFVVIKVGLHNMPPLMLAGLRFLLVAFPALLFVARPKIPLSLLLGYGLTISFGQFAFLFCAISLGMPAGLASLVLQAQAFFTIILGAFIFGERLQGKQLAGIALAIFGVLVLVEASLGGQHVPLVGFMLTLAAALSWACGKYLQQENYVACEPAADYVFGGVERADPRCCRLCWRRGSSTARRSWRKACWHIRSADDPVAALSGVYCHHRRLWYLGGAARPL